MSRSSGQPPGDYNAKSGAVHSESVRDMLAVLGSAERKQRRQRPSEFSHGAGLVAPELADAAPADGGRYRGREASETLGDPTISGPAQRRAPRGSPTPRG